MKFNSGLAEGIERVLELSVDAHVKRREVGMDSPEFHKLTGAITAYGRVLALLTALQQGEEFYEIVGQHPSERIAASLKRSSVVGLIPELGSVYEPQNIN